MMNLDADLVKDICSTLLDNTNRLNEMDRICGDGETGTNLARGAELVSKLPADQMTFRKVGLVLNSAGCGTLGTIWSFLLMSLASAPTMAEALQKLTETFKRASGAEVGQKTMADSFLPWVQELMESSDFSKAKEAALAGAKSTETMVGQKGRASYAGEACKGTMDPGAYASSLVLSKISDYLIKERK